MTGPNDETLGLLLVALLGLVALAFWAARLTGQL